MSEEENRQFKVAMSNFHKAKKSLDEENQHKNYLVLKLIFERREENKQLFKEVEAFIRYKPQKTADSLTNNRISLKRKLNENE